MTEGDGYIYNTFKEAIMQDIWNLPEGYQDIVIEFDDTGGRRTCPWCSNPSGFTDKRGMCISCGGPHD